MTARLATRFAPSPNGHLHLGHAYSALTAWDWAQAHGAEFILRIEDIDTGRARAEFEASILDDLAWLGLAWPAPVRRQSEHFDFYARGLDRLAGLGLTYPCFCTRKEIAAEVAASPAAPHGPEGPLYPGTCRTLSTDARAAKIAAGAPYAVRLDVARAMDVALRLKGNRLDFEEEGQGPDGETGRLPARPELLGDVVLARKDVPVSYHLCVVMDDALQGITHVIRGHDLFHATHIHRLLQVLLDLPAPAYRHHGLIRDETGERLAKRKGSPALRDLRAQGATPQEVRRRAGLA